MNAERVYSKLVEMKLNERQLERLKAEFFVDGHDLWEEDKTNSQIIRRQNQWKDNRERMQTELESFGTEDESGDSRDLLEQVQAENRESGLSGLSAKVCSAEGRGFHRSRCI